MFNIDEELKKIPNVSGVYLMYDDEDNIIYVGKAKNLKNRVRQYFKNSNNSVKTLSLVKKIQKFEYIVTNTEVEALILENNLIKKYEPKYNIRLKDDKTYPYVKITTNEMYPRVFITRKHLNDKAKYFGPFTNALFLKDSIELIHNLFPLRTCSLKFPKDIGRVRPCLNFHINKCLAPCDKMINEEDYNLMINKVIDFFNGKYNEIIKELEEKMLAYSENLEFEKAGEIRDKIFSIKKLSENQFVENMDNSEQDVIAMARVDTDALFQMFFVRCGKITGREHFMINNVENLVRQEVLETFIKQFYSGTPFIPKEILIQEDIEDRQVIEEWLSTLKGQKVTLIIPKRGEKKKLLDIANKNAVVSIERFAERIKRENKMTIGAINEISNALKINKYLKRIEAYDISNTQGIDSVAAMIVFEDGRPLRTDYRKFKIKYVIGANDYASMQEVIKRRFLRYLKEKEENLLKGKFNKLPDIIFLDGGTGQVNAVKKVLDDLELDILVCGMVKDDNHKTRGLIFNNNEIELKKSSEAFKLITRIQDEVHRFAIEFHRKSRQKAIRQSILDNIKGIGEKRKKDLMMHFGSIDNIKNSEVEQLLQVSSINKNIAEQIYKFFRT